MKKNTITALYNYFVKNDDTIDLSTVVEDIRSEYEKSAAKAAVKADAYKQAKPIVFAAIANTALTVKDIFNACKDELSENFTVAKIQYALLHYWSDEVEKIDNGKNPFTYKMK